MLVDKLAKIAAGAQAEPRSVTDLVDGLDVTTADAAALFGLVTHAANNHKVTEFDEHGKRVTCVKRDSIDRPKSTRSAAVVPVPARPLFHARARSLPEPLCHGGRP